MEDQGKRYDQIASDFAEMRDSFSTEQKYVDLLIDYLKSGSSILDLGCGSGFPIASYLMDHGFKLTGVDASIELLKIAQISFPRMECIYGDLRTVELDEQYDAIIEWWALFHIPKEDHAKIIARCASWLKPGGILEFTTGDHEYAASSSDMLNQELDFYSHAPEFYERQLKKNGFEILLSESDQETHLVWIARKS